MFIDQEHPDYSEDEQQEEEGLTLEQFTGFFNEILEQPVWRSNADKEMDYKDGNQINSSILSKMQELGIPPAMHPLIGPAIESILGAEAKQRTDWRVVPDHDKTDDEVADAFNFKLNQAERRSRADRACSDAYESQISVGLGWVEVKKEKDPFKYPYRCNAIHRNEIWWDWFGAKDDPMLTNCRWLIRAKWFDKDAAKLAFPDKKEIIQGASDGWRNFDAFSRDGGQSTGLYSGPDIERGWSVEEQEWRDIAHRRVRIFECWYRTWHDTFIIRSPDGRVIEVDLDNPMHQLAIGRGLVTPEPVVLSKMHRSYWCGPHKLADEPSPYTHNNFPYVPFWGHREDRTGVPFGVIRGMMYHQDNVNATESKIRWGLSAIRVERTARAYMGSDERLREEVARPDADIILDPREMAQPGARFEVKRDFNLSEQQYKMLVDSRQAIQSIANISDEYQGQQGSSTSGVQFNAQVERSNQAQANLSDNFDESRQQVGQLLLSMIIQDSIGRPENVKLPATVAKPKRVIALNQPAYDPENGLEYLNNDVERVLLKVVLEDIPNTPSFRTQQLWTMGEAFKSSPPEAQQILMPHLISLMDIPNRQEIIEAIKQSQAGPSLGQQEIEIRAKQAEAQLKLAQANAVKILADAQFAAMQGASQVVDRPYVAPIADVIMQNAGFQQPNPPGNDPNFPIPAQGQPAELPPNTAPNTPVNGGAQRVPVPPGPQAPMNALPGPMTGSETQRTTDNLP